MNENTNLVNPMCESCAMKIYFFELDSETKIFKAGCADENGKRFLSLVWSTRGRGYVRTGSRRDGTLRIYWLTNAQEDAFAKFSHSGKYSEEYTEGIV